MIVIETKLKVLPKKCNKCKYSYFNYGHRFCAVSFKDELTDVVLTIIMKQKNCEYGKLDWCPFKEIEPVGSGKYFCEVNK